MKKFFLLLTLTISTHLFLLVFLQFIAWPEMVLWPYLLDKGLLPYRDIIIVYPPALIILLALLGKIFGITLIGLKLYTWILILLTDLLIFFVTKKITDNVKVAFISLLFYVLWQPFFEGNAMWFDLVLAPLALLVFYLLWRREFLGSGILFGLAISIKQTAFWFFVPIMLTFWLTKELKPNTLVKFVIGSAVLPMACLLYLVQADIFQDFFQWAINFGVFYLPRAPGQVLLPTVKNILAVGVPYGLLLMAVFMFIKRKTGKEKSSLLLLLPLWALFGVLGTYPRWEYFHFQPSLPFLAVVSGLVISSLKISLKKKSNFLILLYLILIFFGTVYLQARFYRLNWQKPTRFFETDVLDGARWLKENTKSSEKIYILNSWDHLYALSDTLPAVAPLIHTLSWQLEYPGMQEKYVADLTKNKPRIVVFEPYYDRGWGSGIGLYKPEKIDKFLQENYILEEIIAGRFWILKKK